MLTDLQPFILTRAILVRRQLVHQLGRPYGSAKHLTLLRQASVLTGRAYALIPSTAQRAINDLTAIIDAQPQQRANTQAIKEAGQ